MYFKIELNAKLGKWVIYICNRWVYVALREPVTFQVSGDSNHTRRSWVKLFDTWDQADQFARTTGLHTAYTQRNFKHESQTPSP